MDKFNVFLKDGKLGSRKGFPGFPFTKIDCGDYRTRETFFARNSSNQVFTNSPQTLSIDTSEPFSDTVAFTLSSGELTAETNTNSYITYSVTADNSNNARSENEWWLELDTGSGFNLVEGSLGKTYHRTVNQGGNSATKGVALQLETGDKIRVRGERSSGSDNIAVADQCTILIDPEVPKTEPFLCIDAGEEDNSSNCNLVRFDLGEIE